MVGVFANVEESSSSDSSALTITERRVLPRRGVGLSIRSAAMAAFALDMGESFLKGDSDDAIVGVSGADSSSSSSSGMARGTGFFLLNPSTGGAVTGVAFGTAFGVAPIGDASFRGEDKELELSDGGSEAGSEGCILAFAIEFCRALRTAGP